MSDYAPLDGVIKAWVEATGSKLLTEWAGQPARFFYVSGDPFECFQVSVRLPKNGQTEVRAWGVVTDDDAELESTWEGAATELDAMLGAAVTTIENWKHRTRGA